jgi:hypothetical protein
MYLKFRILKKWIYYWAQSAAGITRAVNTLMGPRGSCKCKISPLHFPKQHRVFTPWGEQRGEHSPSRSSFTPGAGGQVHSWGPSSPLGLNFTPIGKLTSLNTGLWSPWSQSYNRYLLRVVKIYNTTSSLVRFDNKKSSMYIEKTL